MSPLLALSLLAAPPAAAQQGRVDLSAAAGWFFSPQEIQNQVNVAVVPRLGYNVADNWAIEADIGFSTGLNDGLDTRYAAFAPRPRAYEHIQRVVGGSGWGPRAMASRRTRH